MIAQLGSDVTSELQIVSSEAKAQVANASAEATAAVRALVLDAQSSILAVNSSVFDLVQSFSSGLNAHVYPIQPLTPLNASGPNQSFDASAGSLFSIQSAIGSGSVSTVFVPNCGDRNGHFFYVVNMDSVSHTVNCYNEGDPSFSTKWCKSYASIPQIRRAWSHWCRARQQARSCKLQLQLWSRSSLAFLFQFPFSFTVRRFSFAFSKRSISLSNSITLQVHVQSLRCMLTSQA